MKTGRETLAWPMKAKNAAAEERMVCFDAGGWILSFLAGRAAPPQEASLVLATTPQYCTATLYNRQ